MWVLRSRRGPFPCMGGYCYTQPQTGWVSRSGATFDEVCNELIAHRQANPRFNLPTDLDTVRIEVDSFTCQNCGNDPNYCVNAPSQGAPDIPWTNDPGDPEKKALSPFLPGAGASVVAAAGKYIKHTTAGIGLYLEWFGQGGPVAAEQAERRAAICLTCPQNNTKLSIAQHFNQIVASNLMKVMGMLNDMSLHTSNEDKLGVCVACSCPVGAKSFSPIGIILNHIRPESKAALDARCWLLEEERALTTTQQAGKGGNAE